jgi:hypothetical protein
MVAQQIDIDVGDYERLDVRRRLVRDAITLRPVSMPMSWQVRSSRRGRLAPRDVN